MNILYIKEGVNTLTYMLTKRDLIQMIEEEIDALNELNAHHDSRGRFSNRSKSKVYSLTQNAVDDLGTGSDLKAPARGKPTGKNKVSAKFGMNTGSPDKQCGKLTIDGKPKKKSRRCMDYPKKYWDKIDEEEVLSSTDDVYLKNLVKQEVSRLMKQINQASNNRRVGCDWQSIMKAVTDIERAQKGGDDK